MRVGDTVRCVGARFRGSTKSNVRWLRNKVAISGGGRVTYRLRKADVGRRVSCRVTAFGPGGKRSIFSFARPLLLAKRGRLARRALGARRYPAEMSDPPLDRWSEDEALRELARLAADLPHVDAEEAWRRLGRLTDEQRAIVEGALAEVLEEP
jgi:hypothetical protein